jgi:hypothetical protein
LDIEQQIEDLKNALREVMKMVTQRGEPLSEELKLQVARVMEHVASRIQQLREEQQNEEPVEQLQPNLAQPKIQEAMPSSNVFGFNYDYDNQKLLVKFQGNDGVGQGPIYSYEGVPRYIFDLFKRGAAIAKTTGHNKWGSWWTGKTPSIGAAMHSFIKNGGYAYQRLS